MSVTQKNRFKKAFLCLIFLFFQKVNAQITLTNNIGETLVKTDMLSCEQDESWSRVFNLADFGIAPNEQFVIKSAQLGISKSDTGSNLYLWVYSIDSKFPNYDYSLYPETALGYRGLGRTPLVSGAPQILKVDFDEPIIVPAGVSQILVSVQKIEDFYNPDSAELLVAGTEQDKGESWYVGCGTPSDIKSTKELSVPVPNANFFVTVTGDVIDSKISGPITRLTHNICDDVIETDMYSCWSAAIYWARDFTLKDFGISKNEEYVITSGQVGVNKVGWGSEVTFNIYKIDENFPASFSTADLIGSSQTQALDYNSSRNSQVVQVDFKTPIVVPAGVERILVEVYKGVEYGEGLAFIAGSAQDNGTSWQRGCSILPGSEHQSEYVSTAVYGVPDANFYINVTGNVKNISNHFEMNFSNICAEFLKEFSVDDPSKVACIDWNFGDPASGANNVSTELSPFHDFSADGKYTVTAKVTGKDGKVEILCETMDVKEPPKAYGINDIYACESIYGTGISKSFDVSMIMQQVLGGQTNKTVTFIDGKGNKYTSLPNPFANTIKDRETITVRVSHKDNLCCYSETTFDLIVNPMPNLSVVADLNVCDNDTDGFAQFNLKALETSVIGAATNLKIEFYHQNGQKIEVPLNAVSNLIAKEETIKIKVINTTTNCCSEATFKLIVNPLPVANPLQTIMGCDDNSDGISEYFDTSNVEAVVLGNQQGMKVSYFDSNGSQLQGPLPNPYTNKIKNEEIITVRVANNFTNCYAETALVLKTASKPSINKPSNKYTCDEGNGFGTFDLSHIENEIIGNQSGLKIMYFDASGNPLPSPLPALFQNTQAKIQTIKVRVENETNSLCN